MSVFIHNYLTFIYTFLNVAQVFLQLALCRALRHVFLHIVVVKKKNAFFRGKGNNLRKKLQLQGANSWYNGYIVIFLKKLLRIRRPVWSYLDI